MSEEFLKQLSNFINALIAIAPSRNYVTQFLYVIKMNENIDYRILEEAYPEIMKDEYTREAFAKVFGISFGEKVSLESGKYGAFLTEFIDKIFQLFEDSEFRARVSALLKEEFPEGVPNLAEEWLDMRLRGLISEPTYGKDSVRVLKEIMRVGRAKVEDLERALDISRGTIIECLKLLDVYKLTVRDYDGNYKVAESIRKYPEVLEGIKLE